VINKIKLVCICVESTTLLLKFVFYLRGVFILSAILKQLEDFFNSSVVKPTNITKLEQRKEFEKDIYKSWGDRKDLFEIGKKVNEMVYYEKPKRFYAGDKQVKILFGFNENRPDRRTPHFIVAEKGTYNKRINKSEYNEILTNNPTRKTFMKTTPSLTFDFKKIEDLDDMTFIGDNTFFGSLDAFECYEVFVVNGTKKHQEMAKKYGEIHEHNTYYVEFPTMKHSFKRFPAAYKYTTIDTKGHIDCYFCTSTTYKRQRKTEFVTEISLCFTELDYYKLDKYKNHTNQEMLGLVLTKLIENDFPIPTEVIFSRGLQLLWKISPLPSYQAKNWEIVQRKIYNLLKEFGSDSAVVTDTVRLLRLAGTIHSGTDKSIFGYSYTEDRYDFMDLLKTTCYEEYEDLLERRAKAIEIAKKNKNKPKLSVIKGNQSTKAVSYEDSLNGNQKAGNAIHMAYLKDLISLIGIRNYEMVGLREISCFLTRYWSLCVTGSKVKALNEMKNVFYSVGANQRYTFEEMITLTSSAEKAWGNWQEDWKKGYNYSNRRLVELLDITREEEKQLKKIMSEREAAERKKVRDKNKKRNKYRQQGMLEREEYVKQMHDKTDNHLFNLKQALEQNPKAKRQELAELLGVSVYRIDQLKRELKKSL
jgi:Spy/CpxP family protein refolding chaperone